MSSHSWGPCGVPGDTGGIRVLLLLGRALGGRLLECVPFLTICDFSQAGDLLAWEQKNTKTQEKLNSWTKACPEGF